MGLPLSDGDQVCIVGGGPAGSFAALHLLRLARQEGLRLKVLIFEPRDFTQPGPGGCNRCAGILSTRLLRGLDSLGLTLPPEVIQAKIQTYTAHVNDKTVRIEQPDPQSRIVSVYRGGGPRLLEGDPLSSFDNFLLQKAVSRGAAHIPAHVRKVTGGGRPMVHTARASFPAALLVLATGANSRSPLAPEFGYRPPQTAVMAQDEFLRPDTWPENQVSAFFRKPSGLIFGAMIPKGRYLNVSLLGKGLSRDAVEDFIQVQGLNEALASTPARLCGCTPRIAVGAARRFFGTRWVAVGDASVTRLYKDGVGSAFYTAQTAMQSALGRGVSRRDFQAGYAPYCRSVAMDNLYGRLLYKLWEVTLRSPRLSKAWRLTIQQEAAAPPADRVYLNNLWGMFTGDAQYRELFWRFCSPPALVRFLRNLPFSITRRPE